MDQKERLVEWLTETFDEQYEKRRLITPHHTAVFLLENGVILLPCAIGTHLWRVTHPYRQEPKVTEFVVKNFRTVGKKHQLQIEVQALNVPGTNWMRFEAFRTTKEEAEADLAERKAT